MLENQPDWIKIVDFLFFNSHVLDPVANFLNFFMHLKVAWSSRLLLLILFLPCPSATLVDYEVAQVQTSAARGPPVLHWFLATATIAVVEEFEGGPAAPWWGRVGHSVVKVELAAVLGGNLVDQSEGGDPHPAHWSWAGELLVAVD